MTTDPTTAPQAASDVDSLPPTQYLVLETLAARHRLGEPFWTFPTRLSFAVRMLEDAGLVWSRSAPTPNAMQVSLTDAGCAAVLHYRYQPPTPEPPTPGQALRGPWHAVLADNYGDLRDSVDDFDEGEHIQIAVVRGSAAPSGTRLPGTYRSADVLYQLVDLADEDGQEIADRWEQAQAIAAALNELDAAPAADPGAAPADQELIGPLTPAEWCSLRLREDDPLQCCGVTSEFRDALFMLLRMGGQKHDAWVLAEAWQGMDAHGWPEGVPEVDKIREFYGPLSTTPPTGTEPQR